MPMVSAKLVSKLNIFSRKRHLRHVPVPDIDSDSEPNCETDDCGDAKSSAKEGAQDFRTRGSAILEAISAEAQGLTTTSVTSSTTTGQDENNGGGNHKSTIDGISSSDIEMNWKETIEQFRRQKREQEQIQKQTKGDGNEDNRTDGVLNKVQRLKLLKRALERRRKLDSKGSFAINMVTLRDEDEACGREVARGARSNLNCNSKKNKYKNYKNSGKSGETMGCDDRSRSTITTSVSNDLTLKVIDEESEYCPVPGKNKK